MRDPPAWYQWYVPWVTTLIAAGIATWQAWDAHVSAQFARQPAIVFDTEDDPTMDPLGVSIENPGNGPATIRWTHYYNDKNRIDDVDDLVAAAGLNANQYVYWKFDAGDALGVGQKEWLLMHDKKFSGDKKERAKFADFLEHHLGIEVQACSLANECATKCSTKGLCSTEDD
jgi:hypothetical protein